MEKQELKDYLINLIDESIEFILYRALEHKDVLDEDDKIDLFDIEVCGKIFEFYDIQDLENHNYDLARYNTLKEILTLLND